MRKKLSIIVLFIITIALVVATVALRKVRTQSVMSLAPVTLAPWAVQVSPVYKGKVTQGFPVLAKLATSADINIASQIYGLIDITGPREGIKVNAGDVLVRVLTDDLIAEKAGLEELRKTALIEKKRTQDEFQRQQVLINKKLTSQELFETKKSAAISAKNQVFIIDKRLSAINVRISYGIVRAPVDAVISAKLAEPGDIAQPGKTLYTLTVDSGARVRVQLPQQILEKITVGSRVQLTHAGKNSDVYITRIFPALNNNMGIAESDLSDVPFSLRSGARVTARIILEESDSTLVIPHSALLSSANGEGENGFVYKFINENGIDKIQKVAVKILLNGDEGIAISGDLSESDRVVIAHQSILIKLQNNDLVSATMEKTDVF